MRYNLLLIVFLALAGLGSSLSAQHVELDEVEIRDSGEAYLKSIRFRRIQSSVAYYDPTRPSPPLETRQSVQREQDESRNAIERRVFGGDGYYVSLLIVSLILLGIAYLFVTFGGRLPVSFARTPQDGDDLSPEADKTSQSINSAPKAIQSILQIKDRRIALVSLCKSLLARSVAAEGVLIQDSWTDRDMLRRVPKDNPHRDAIQSLVYASERVQFGGRDVSEDEFQGHVERLKAIWRKALP